MAIGFIIFIIILGMLLFMIEFLLVPGITIAGIGGAICMIGGIIMAYHFHGSVAGNITLLGTALFAVAMVYFMLKSGTWKKFMLSSSITGKVNSVETEDHIELVKVGDTGESVTRLNPMGKVQIGDNFFEAKALDRLIDPQTEIVVLKIIDNNLIVKPKND
jgi:membrane-bound ClpP family serine protease